MRNLFCALTLSILLAACTQAASLPEAVSSRGASSSAAPRVIEPYPMEFSAEHFKNMALSGSNLAIGKVIEQNSAWAKHFITYTSNGVKISGTLALPKAEGAHRLIVLNHGYIDPAVYTNGRGLRREQDALARAGFAVLHTDYRKHAQSDPDPDTRNIYDNMLAYALDSANAVLAVRELNDPRINAEKVGMLGHSMGGGVTLHILAEHPELIDAAVLYAPVNADAWANFERWRIDDAEESAATLAALKTKDENPAAWAALSQSGHLKNIEDPILLTHGLKDADVPVAWSNDLDYTLETLGKDTRYVTYPKEGHEYSESWKHFIDMAISFYNEKLQ